MKHILFDLDGTLLPMIQDQFLAYYMPLLAKKYNDAGIKTDIRAFIGNVWTAYEAMVKNTGEKTNREAFWDALADTLPISKEEAEQIAVSFYENEFNQAKASTMPNPLADKVVKKAKEKGIKVYLATNPVFPKAATANRIAWAGLDATDFEVITTYEDQCYCKPNPLYFARILERFSIDPSDCMMVGNDVIEDLAIQSLGVKVFLVTDTLENKKNITYKADYEGTMEELLHFIEDLPEIED